MLEEIERLQAIVDKLPVLADGVTPWERDVWDRKGMEWRVLSIARDGMIEVNDNHGTTFWRPASDYYSTREAAEATRKET